MSNFHFFIKILVFLCSICLSGQNFDDHKFINFTVEHGLPSNEVYEVFEDSKGYIWIGTDRGVSIYNGYEFKTYTTADGLPDNTIFNFYEDKIGRIWLFSFNGKVGFYFNGEFNTLKLTIPYKHINGIINNNDIVEVVYPNSKLLKFKLINDETKSVEWKEAEEADYKRIINEGRYKYGIKLNNSKSLINEDGLLKLINTQKKLKSKITGLTSTNGFKFLTTSDGFVEEINFAKSITFRERVRLKNSIPSNATKDKFGGVWISTLNNGVLYCSKIEIPTKYFIEDVKGRGLLRYFRNEQFEIIVNKDKELFVKEDDEYKKIDDLSGNMGFIKSTAQNFIIDSKNRAIEIDAKSGNIVKHEAKLYYPTIKGLNSFKRLEKPYKSYTSCFSNRICFLEDSSCVKVVGAKRLTSLVQQKDTIWAGGLEGLFAISLKDKKQLDIGTDSTLNFRVNYVTKLNDNILVATRGNGLYIKEGKQIHVIKEENGLIDNSLSKIVHNSNDVIWVSSNKGISKIKFSSFSPLQYSIENIVKEDGLLSLKINDLQYFENKILVLTDELLYELPEKQSIKPFQLHFYIKNVSINNNIVDPTALKSLSYKQNNVEINYEALYYPNPKGLHYKYSNDNGVNWQTTSYLSLNYLNLTHGTYNVLLKAVTSKGIESEVRVIKFTIAPPFWKAKWFLVLSLILLIITIGMIVKYVLRQQKMKSKAVEMELKALKSQMSPHFTFNSMNSIQSFILDNKQEEALSFVAKYSKLVRLILNNSSEKAISLQKEIDALKLYLDIEQVRLNHKFDYFFNIEDEVGLDYVSIPALILQPYVENAIWHGISNKKGKGTINISFSIKDDLLSCIIEDDGVGRLEAEKLKSKRTVKHKSFGLNITAERLKLINSSKKIVGVNIIDLLDKKDKSLGTRVVIQILVNTI